jgi:hypothetical protein
MSRLLFRDLVRTIIVNEAPRKRDRFDPRYEARMLDESESIAVSETPFLDTARALIARGDDPQSVIVMRRASSDVEGLRSTIGAAAKLTVREDSNRRPMLVAYEPFSSAGIAAPVEAAGPSATQVAPTEKNPLLAPLPPEIDKNDQ